MISLIYTYINFTSSEILLGTPEDIPPLFDLFLITAKMHMYVFIFFIVVGKSIYTNISVILLQ